MTDSDVKALILAATAPDDEAGRAIGRIGVAKAVSVLLDELVSRADLDDIGDHPTVTVRFDLAFAGEVTGHVLKVDKGGAVHDGGPDAEADAVVSQDLTDLLRGVYGIRAQRTNPTRSISWKHLKTPSAFVQPPWVFTTVRRLLAGSQDSPSDLADLSIRFDSDKWGLHFYTPHYERHFAPLRDLPVTVLEIGVGGYSDPDRGGGSLRMWKRYFHRGTVHGVDTYDKSGLEEQRIDILQGSQSDPEFLARLAEHTGPLDIVIDDGSHVSSDVVTSFQHLFAQVRPGGLYVVEDLQMSYWPGYGGNSQELNDPATSVGFVKTLVDGLHHEEFEPAEARVAAPTDTQVAGLHFYHNLVIIEKASNTEGTVPAWIPRRQVSR
uniref:Putative sugar O-methyltransferase n=1 Tax=Streptomyces versipellis TaxID=67375 RepID=A0A0B6VRG1_9ACTN|nr:putative sugar O-methyltransferase [Streptomyces versipellis]